MRCSPTQRRRRFAVEKRRTRQRPRIAAWTLRSRCPRMSSPVRLRAGDGGHPQLVGIRNWRASTTVKKQRSPRNGARLDRARGIDHGLIVGESPRQGAASFSSKPVLKTTDNAGGHPSMTLALGVTKSPRHCSRFLFGISESIGICAGLLLSVNRDFCLTAICRRNLQRLSFLLLQFSPGFGWPRDLLLILSALQKSGRATLGSA